jgi:hypothetical protein
MAKPGVILGLGAAALLLMRGREGDAKTSTHATGGLPEEGARFGSSASTGIGTLYDAWISPHGEPQVGKLYQVVRGDDPLVVARKALFGSADPRIDASERNAVIEFSIRIDCGPWNQTVNSRPRAQLGPGHHAVDKGYTQKGVHYAPVFPDNASRLRSGRSPVVGTGNSYPLIWIPRIDLEKFSRTFEVTTLGQNWPDDGEGSYNMIDPPPWVVDLAFTGDINMDSVGCHLPEGDFRRSFESDG